MPLSGEHPNNLAEDLPPARNKIEPTVEQCIEEMRARGLVARLENGLDGTWECTFYDPKDEPSQRYGAGPTMEAAVKQAADFARQMTPPAMVPSPKHTVS